MTIGDSHLRHLLVATMCCCVFSLSATNLIQFKKINLEEAKSSAVKEEKLLLVSFTAPWCLACEIMNESIYSDPEIASIVNQSFVPIKADIESMQGKDWNDLYNSNYLPTVVFAGKDGYEFERTSGVPSKAKFLAILKKLQPVAKVQVDNVQPKKELSKVLANQKIAENFSVQIGAFKSYENAERMLIKAKNKLPDYSFEINTHQGQTKVIYKVRLSGYLTEEKSLDALSLLKNQGFDGFVTKG